MPAQKHLTLPALRRCHLAACILWVGLWPLHSSPAIPGITNTPLPWLLLPPLLPLLLWKWKKPYIWTTLFISGLYTLGTTAIILYYLLYLSRGTPLPANPAIRSAALLPAVGHSLYTTLLFAPWVITFLRSLATTQHVTPKT